MFYSFEKKYKDTLSEVKFNRVYLISSAIILFIGYILIKIFPDFMYTKIKYIYSFGSIIAVVILYFIIDFIKVVNKLNINKKEKLATKFTEYREFKKCKPLNDLLRLLNEYNFKTKDDLKLVIDYYNSKQSIKIESSPLSLIVSVLISLSTLVSIAYDDQSKSLSSEKAATVIGTTIGYGLIFILIAGMGYFIINYLLFSNKRLYSTLSEELSYIYVNYGKYKKQLNR